MGKQVVLAIFPNEPAADVAAQSLKDWDELDDVKLNAIGILVLDEEGKVKTQKLGRRSWGKGADRRRARRADAAVALSWGRGRPIGGRGDHPHDPPAGRYPCRLPSFTLGVRPGTGSGRIRRRVELAWRSC